MRGIRLRGNQFPADFDDTASDDSNQRADALGAIRQRQAKLLLVGTRGNVPAPAPGQQYPSAITAPPGRHNAKPAVFAEMIDRMFPTVPGAELFARAKRTGWAVWGNEVAP